MDLANIIMRITFSRSHDLGFANAIIQKKNL